MTKAAEKSKAPAKAGDEIRFEAGAGAQAKAGVKAVVILGPTASGKSALALQLARQLPCEIISMDSAQIYRGMDIGTAKPSLGELAEIPHHLINIRDPSEAYSAAEFRDDCLKLAGEIAYRGALPVICGGTMMYYKALCAGLSPLPSTTPEIRKRVAQLAASEGWEALHERLQKVDPPLYRRLSPRDRQRISRALEIYLATGRPMSSYLTKPGGACPLERLEFVLMPPPDRQELRVQIRRRFLRMLKEGLEEEVRKLKEREDLSLSLPSMRAVGYRQVWNWLDGQCTREEMIELAVIATARLAKHQMTWLRGALGHPDAGVSRRVLHPGDADNLRLMLEDIGRFSVQKNQSLP